MQAVILAAGESSRFWPLNKEHKTLIKIMGKPLIWYTLESLKKNEINNIIIVQGPNQNIENTLKEFNDLNIKYVIQKESKGMGNALLCAKDLLEEQFFLLNAERFDSADYIKFILEKYKKTNSKAVLLGTKTLTPWLFGILNLEGERIKDIIEKPERGKEPSNVRVVGIYFLSKSFLDYYQMIPEEMYSFEKALSVYMKENDVRAVISEDQIPFFKYPWHIIETTKRLMDLNLKPKISKSAKIAKNVVIEGNVFIGENSKIFEGAVIKGPCFIGDNCIIGNNSLIRDYTNLENDVLIGAFAEVTRSIFQKGTHTHSGYFGDSIFGKNCRIGAGTIIANVKINREEIKTTVKGEKILTGLQSLGCIVGDNVKIGIHTSFMPGVLVGSNCIIGPKSLVKDNLEDNSEFWPTLK